MRRRHLLGLAAASVGNLCAFSGSAGAQNLASRPLRLVVPFPAGSATDNVARLLAREFQAEFSQPAVVENRPGAQGLLGAEMVARSPADSNTFLVAAVSFAAAPSMFRKIPFDPIADFVLISQLVTTPLVLMVRSEMPVKSIQDFIDYARSRRTGLSAGYGSSSSQVCIAQLAALTKLSFVSVGYKGIPLAVNDLLAGAIDFTFADLGNAVAQSKGGRLKAIGVTSGHRSAIVPEWPALSETVPGYDIDAWIALLGPRGTGQEVSQSLSDAARKAFSRPDVIDRLASFGFTPYAESQANRHGFLRSEIEKWARLSKQAGIEPE